MADTKNTTKNATTAAKPATASTAEREAPKIATGTIDGFTPPAQSRGGGASARYPFDSLTAAGEYFSVGNKTKRQMAAPVARANKAHRTELKDAAGNVQSRSQEREFYAVDVDADTAAKLVGTPHEGAKVLVVRSK